ncbi:MAG: SAM-dependent methyltransferase [Nocardioides sp.]
MAERTFAMLISPSANRVYARSALDLTSAELGVFGETVLSAPLHDVRPEVIGGVSYLGFRGLPTGADLAVLSNTSTALALFERVGDLLRPVPLTPLAVWADDLVSVQKYAGKTNETFTQLLLNVTLAASVAGPALAGGAVGPALAGGAAGRSAGQRRVRVLDPLCGRGTTLNVALRYGFDVAGIESDAKDVEAYAAFLRSWLKRSRVKHTLTLRPVRHHGRPAARRMEATLAADAAAARADDTQSVTVVEAATERAEEFFRARSMDAVVADAPYGVQHGSRARGNLARSPLDLLAEAVPGWARLLRPGGALGLSWNTKVAPRAAVAGLLVDAGLEPCTTEAYAGFSHRVDQAIQRDLIVARRR